MPCNLQVTQWKKDEANQVHALPPPAAGACSLPPHKELPNVVCVQALREQVVAAWR